MGKQYSSQSSPDPTETTRYLCAAAHLDPEFRDYVMEHIIYEEHKAIIASYGVDVDMVTVAKYCLSANERKLKYDLVLFFLMLLALILFLFLHYFLWSLALFLLAWIIVSVEEWFQHYGSTAVGLTKEHFQPGNLDYLLDQRLDEKLRMLSETGTHNVIVYSGSSPFIGAGQSIGGWSFTINIAKGKTPGEKPDSFLLTEFYNYLHRELSELDIKELRLDDKLFVNGQEIRDDTLFVNGQEIPGEKFFLADPSVSPCTNVDQYLVSHISEHPTQNIRYYKCIQVTSWSGELVLSIFLKFSKVGKKNLLVEAHYFLLTPVRENYRKIDATEASFTWRKFLPVLCKAFFLALFALISLSRRYYHVLVREQKENNRQYEIEKNPAFDYGASSSLREFASSRTYKRHFQQFDKEMYAKVIENQILDGIIKFLETKNISTSDIKERQELILNNGILIYGGEFKENNFTIKDLFSNKKNASPKAEPLTKK